MGGGALSELLEDLVWLQQNPDKNLVDADERRGKSIPPRLFPIKFYESQSPEDMQRLDENVRINRTKGIPIFQPDTPKKEPILILSGGPSLNQFGHEILGFNGPVMAIGQVHKWCIEHAVPFDMAVFSDPRERTIDYIEQIHPAAKYFAASHCPPEMVTRLMDAPNFELFHVGDPSVEYRFKDQNGEIEHYISVAAHTSLLGIKIAILSGYTDIHLIGMDSCYMGDQHHAYDKPTHKGKNVRDVFVNGRVFFADDGMIVQALEIKDFVVRFGHKFSLTIYGDGLIANMFQPKESK